MRAGLLNEVITIKKAEVLKNSYGQETTEFKDFIKTKARIKYTSGNRVIENNEIINTYTVTFIIRNYHKIDEFMRIQYNKRLYRINSIEENKLDQSITIIGELING